MGRLFKWTDLLDETPDCIQGGYPKTEEEVNSSCRLKRMLQFREVDISIRMETKSCRILRLTYAAKYDMT